MCVLHHVTSQYKSEERAYSPWAASGPYQSRWSSPVRQASYLAKWAPSPSDSTAIDTAQADVSAGLVHLKETLGSLF